MSIKRIVEDQFGMRRTGNSLFIDGTLINVNIPGTAYFVSRNKTSSGNGKSWDRAYTTWTEGIAALNTAYAAQRQVNVLFIEEGWYAELPMTLTASDCYIIGVAPGHHDSTVLYGVPVAGTFSGVAGGPALSVTGSNNTIANLGFYTSDPLYPGLRNGANASDPDGPAASNPTGNSFINLGFVRDVADGELGGIDEMGADGTLIDGCFFGTSCKDWGVRIRSNGVINPVNTVVKNCRFIGTPKGIKCDAGHNIELAFNSFHDDTSDRADVVDEPIEVNGATVRSFNNWSTTTNKAGLVTANSGTSTEAGNYATDSAT